MKEYSIELCGETIFDSINDYMNGTFNNRFSILGLISGNLKRYLKRELEEYLYEQGAEIRKCGFCNNFSKISSFKILRLEKNIIYIKDISYHKNMFFCYKRGCPGKKLNPNSINFVSKSRNISENEALDLIHRRNKSQFYECNHSSKEDYKKYQSRNEEWYKNKYGDMEGQERWKKYCKRQSYAGVKLGYFIEKYGEEIGKEKYKKLNLSKDSVSFQHFLNKLGSYEKARVEYDKRLQQIVYDNGLLKNKHYCNGVSKESTRNMIRYYKFFRKLGIKREKIFLSSSHSSEYCILYKNNRQRYYYDFAIPEIKLIIEYHGEAFHPNPSWKNTDINRWNSWRSLFGKPITAEEKYEIDQKKNRAAEKEGFTVFEIFSSDDKNKKFIEITEIMKKEVENYVNRRL